MQTVRCLLVHACTYQCGPHARAPGSVALMRGAAVPGIMRGAGRQLLATISNAVVYWAGCCPLAVLLAPRLGVPGLWLALAAATTLQVLAAPCVACEDVECLGVPGLQLELPVAP